jgi:signal transduction histidine kinase
LSTDGTADIVHLVNLKSSPHVREDSNWPALLVNSVLGGTADESRSRGRAAIPRILQVVAEQCQAFGAALWRQRESDRGQIAMMGSWFRGTDEWLILKGMRLQDSCSGRAILYGEDTNNNLKESGQFGGKHPFLIKHRVMHAQSVRIELPSQWVGSVTVYRQDDEVEFGDEDAVKLRAMAGLVPGLFRAALHQAELKLRREIGEIIRQHEENDNASKREREEARRATISKCCKEVQSAFSSLEVSVFIGDLEVDGDPKEFRCSYTTDGPHKAVAEKATYDREKGGYSPLVLTETEYIHVRDTTDEEEEKEFQKKYRTFRPHNVTAVRHEVLEVLRAKLPDGQPPDPPLSLIVSRIEYHGVILGFIRCWVALAYGPKSYLKEDAQLLGLIAQPVARMIFDWRTRDQWRRANKGGPVVVQAQKKPKRKRSDEHDFLVEALVEIDAIVPETSISSVSLKMPTEPKLEIVACSGAITENEWQEALQQRYSVTPGHAEDGDEGEESLASQVYLSGDSEMIPDVKREPRYRHLFAGVRQMIVVPLSTGRADHLGVLELRNRSERDFPPYALPLTESLGRILGLRYAWFLAQRKQIEGEIEFNRAFSDASHQIKGPLATAWKRLDQLLAASSNVVKTSELHPIRALLRRTENAAKLVRLFGDIAANRKFQIAGWPVNPKDLVVAISSLCIDAQTSAHPSREIRVEFDHDSIYSLAPPELRADQELLEQAIWNLLDNGVKYSSPKTVVRVFGGKTQKGRFYLAVSNRGAIILPHEISLCKKRHWRKPEVIPFVGEGNGLGLYIVDEIMRAHGGSLDILPTRILPTRRDGFTEVRLSFDLNLS